MSKLCSSNGVVKVKVLIVSVYVDDLILTRDDKDMMSDFKSSMMRVFDKTDLGSMRFFLGIEVLQKPDGIFIRQRKYAMEVLKRLGCKRVIQ